jgi:hypothetical protein
LKSMRETIVTSFKIHMLDAKVFCLLVKDPQS